MKTDRQISLWTLKQQLRLESQEGCVFKKSGENIQCIQMYHMHFAIILMQLGTETFMQNLKVIIHSKKKSLPLLYVYMCVYV